MNLKGGLNPRNYNVINNATKEVRCIYKYLQALKYISSQLISKHLRIAKIPRKEFSAIFYFTALMLSYRHINLPKTLYD